MADNANVKVAVRVRPLVSNEVSHGAKSIIDIFKKEKQIQVKNKAFTFDLIFGPDSTQREFYNECIEAHISKLFEGYNLTVFAYGQTGSGKTHTMGTAYNGEDDTGVIPRAINQIFNYVKDNFAYDFAITVSFLEIYQENLIDLLPDKPQRDQPSLEIREDSKGVIVPNLTEKPVKSAFEVLNILNTASKLRTVASTQMNAHSSRSHAIFTLNICIQKKGDCNLNKTAKFNLVDLAGSERSKKTGAVGQVFKEGVNINKGLFVLGKVMSALGADKGDCVPYRESSLTRLLKDSLGGNSITLMIACISPADYNCDETITTLRYADNAKKIKNTPIVNEDPKAAELNRLRKLVDQLRLELAGQGGSIICQAEYELLKKENGDLRLKLKDMIVQVTSLLNEKSALFERLFLCQSNSEKFQEKIKELEEKFDTILLQSKSYNEENSSPAIIEFLTQLQDFKKLIEELGKDLKLSENQIRFHEQSNTILSNNSRYSVEPELLEQQENHNTKQYDLNNQLNEVVKNLAMKEHLCQEMEQNALLIIDDRDQIEASNRIQELEKERDELMQQLKHSNSSKVTDHKTRRVKDLELQIQDLKKKIVDLERLKKIKDKGVEKIKQLNSEIVQMKQTKVKLIRQIKQENDNFRTYKIQKEKDLLRLEQKDRKQQTQIIKMQNMHDKKENMLKRKVEEAVAANKRLRDAMALRRDVAKSKMKIGELGPYLKHELDFHVTITDAQTTLTNLIEDRAALTIQVEQNPSLANELQEKIDLINGQISALQQKLMDSKDDDKSKTRWDNIQTMSDCKSCLNILFNLVADIRKAQYSLEHDNNDLKHDNIDLKQYNSELEKRLNNHEIEMHKLQSVYDEKVAMIEKECEQKISIILRREMTSEEQVEQYENIKSKRIESLEEELATLKKTLEEKNKEIEASKTLNKTITLETVHTPKQFAKPTAPKKKSNTTYREPEPDLHSDSPFIDDDVINDPDWHKTPLGKRVRKSRIVKDNENLPSKRTSEGGCNCRSNCGLRYCSCKKIGRNCDEFCKCKKNKCINQDSSIMLTNDIIEDSAKSITERVPLTSKDDNAADKIKKTKLSFN